MFRSLYTGVSGIKSHQLRMDVVGNNIANSNTIAYKRHRTTFNEVMGQQFVGLGRNAGGTSINPAHVGLGVSVGSIEANFAQGALENTGIATDLALNGEGFFVVKNHENRDFLTRAGNFSFNQNGELVSTNGMNVQGWRRNEAGDILTGQLEDIQVDFSARAEAQFSTEVTLKGNLSAEAEVGATNTVTTSVFDEQGKAHTMIVEYTKTAENTWDYRVRPADAAASPFSESTGTLTFNVDGTLAAPPAPITVDWAPGYVTTADAVTLNIDGLSQLNGSTTATVREQNGRPSGELVGFSIGQDGMLTLNFSNGHQENLYQLAIGSVNNPNGLEPMGQNYYGLLAEAGDLVLGRAGNELPAKIMTGSLEMSNVDLATEFTDMIVTQRGYQASARVITTSDELLQEMIQLKR